MTVYVCSDHDAACAEVPVGLRCKNCPERGKGLDPHRPQHCRLGSPVLGFPTQVCNCEAGKCRLGRDAAPTEDTQ